MTKDEIRRKREHLRSENGRYPRELTKLPREKWPASNQSRINVWRSREFLVQAFREDAGITRLTVCRSRIDDKGMWVDGIAWEELQAIKKACGFGAFDAVEIYPTDETVVNVANMRHLWIIPEGLSFGWKGDGSNR